MGRKSRFTIEDKLNAVLDYKNGKRGVTQIYNDLGIPKKSANLYKWVFIYDKHGESGFLPKQTS